MAGTIGFMDANEARTFHMRRLVREAGGPAEWARRFGGARWQQAQISQWISETNPKGIGKRLARELEEVQGLPSGSLDRIPDGQTVAASQPVQLQRRMIAATVTLVRYVQEMALEPIPEERMQDLIDRATEEVAVNWPQGFSSEKDKTAAGRNVIARLRSG